MRLARAAERRSPTCGPRVRPHPPALDRPPHGEPARRRSSPGSPPTSRRSRSSSRGADGLGGEPHDDGGRRPHDGDLRLAPRRHRRASARAAVRPAEGASRSGSSRRGIWSAPRSARCSAPSARRCRAPPSSAPTACRTAPPSGSPRPSTPTARAYVRAGASAPCCSRQRGVRRLHRVGRRARRPGPGTGLGAHRRRDGRLPLPGGAVPGADRRVHRDPRPDPDAVAGLAQGARRPRDADRGARPGPGGAVLPDEPAGDPGRGRHLPLSRRRAPGGHSTHSADVHATIQPARPSPWSGATGSGKSTLAKLLCDWPIPPAAGSP